MSKKDVDKSKSSRAGDLEELFQAVVVADSFVRRFPPITYEVPKVLMPVVNVPLLDYTMECLSMSGVDEVFIVIRHHVEQFERWLSSSQWSKPGFHVQLKHFKDSHSIGDVLREVDKLDMLRNDFLLLDGDLVSTFNMQQLRDAHKANRKQDKSAIMTMLLKRLSPDHRSRVHDDDIVIVTEPQTHQLLSYTIVDAEKGHATKASLDPNLVLGCNSHVIIRYDVVDCHVCFCSPEVLASLSEEVDWNDMRNDFIRGTLVDDMHGYKLFAHVIQGQYAGRVKCLSSYDSVSKDITARWAYPIVPDANCFSVFDSARGCMTPQSKYLEEGVKLAQTCNIQDVVIGSGTFVAANARIYNCIIGRNCKIMDGAEVTCSYLWDNVVVHAGARVHDGCLLASDVEVGAASVVGKGAVLSFGVKIAPNHTVPERTRISCKPTPEEDDEWADDVPAVQPQIRDAAYVGESGIGLLWRPAQNETLGQELSILFKRDDNEDADVFSESEEESEEEGEDEEKTFHSELVETVVRHFKDPGHNTENLMVEVNSLKFSYNATISQCADGLSEALMSVTSIGGDGFSLRVMLKHWSASIIRFCSTGADRAKFIASAWKFHLKDSNTGSLGFDFEEALQLLYENDLIGHRDICEWAKKDKSDELRLTPLSLSWYHSDVVSIIDPLMDGRVSADVVCANLRSLQLRKYATALDTASGIAVNVLNRADGSTDAKAALASVTQSAQKIQDVLNQFVADDACMLAFVSQFILGVAGMPKVLLALAAILQFMYQEDILSDTAIEQWAANALATGGHLAEIAARPGIVKLLGLLKEDDDQDSEEDSD